MKQIGVLFGGVSSEHDVSLLSASAVLQNMDHEKYEAHPVGITKEGDWFYYTGEVSRIADGSWTSDKEHLIPCTVNVSRSEKGLLLFSEDRVRRVALDCVFPVLHGKNGEDGTMQGLLEIAGIPYVGCDTLSSAVCMDKTVTHTVLDRSGIRTAKYISVLEYDYKGHEAEFLAKAEEELGYPMFVKPANAGSSVGISKVNSAADFDQAMRLAFIHDCKVLVEEMIVGLEVECGVLGNNHPVAAIPGSIISCNDWYDYDAKYLAGQTRTVIPAEISSELLEQVRKEAVRAYMALGCSGLSRVDFFVTKEGRLLVNEVNTIPGFTSISMYAKMFDAAGVSFCELIDHLLKLAMEKKEG